MLISLDYDKTYSLDPEFWNDFIELVKKRNHEVICVTMRYPEEGEEVLNSIGKYCKVIFTKRLAKMKFLSEMDIHPDIWIDDSPFWVYKDAF